MINQTQVSKLVKKSRGYVNKVKTGKLANSKKTEEVFQLLSLREEDFLSVLADERMFEVCQVAILRSKHVSVRAFAALVANLNERLRAAGVK